MQPFRQLTLMFYATVLDSSFWLVSTSVRSSSRNSRFDTLLFFFLRGTLESGNKVPGMKFNQSQQIISTNNKLSNICTLLSDPGDKYVRAACRMRANPGRKNDADRGGV